jgi:alpha-mannosidase
VRLPDGRSFAPQVIETGRFWGHEFVRLALPVTVAGLGYAAFAICEEAGAANAGEPGVWQLGERQPQPRSHAEQYREGLENALVRVELDMTTGGIRSLVDKRTGVALIGPERPAPILEYAVERPHGMTAWTIENTGPVSYGEVLSIKRTVSGPFKAAIAVKLRVHDSDVTLTYELAAGDPQLHLRVDAEWFERGTPQTGAPTLRMAFPLALAQARGRYEIAFGAIERDLNAGQEVPALQWAQVMGLADGSGTPAGCLLVNDSKYGYSLDGSTLHMTLIRSSYDPDNLPEIRTHEIHAGLRPLAADLPAAEAIRLGRNFNHALRVVGTDVHAGPLPAAAAFIQTTPESVILSSVKKAETEDALVLTFFDPTGRAATVEARFNEALLGRPVEAVEVDLMERPLAHSTAAVSGDAVTVQVPGRGIVSVKVRIAR